MRRRVAVIAAIVLVVVIGAVIFLVVRAFSTGEAQVVLKRHCHSDGGLPDPACTPGAIDPRVTQANIATTICMRGYTAKVRPPAATQAGSNASRSRSTATPTPTRRITRRTTSSRSSSAAARPT